MVFLSRHIKVRWFIWLFCVFTAITVSFGVSQVSVATSFGSYLAVDVVDGAGLYKKQLSSGNDAYLQVINLEKMRIDQILGKENNQGLGQGKYYRGEGKYKSPFFTRRSFDDVQKQYQQLYSNKVFSIFNSFFSNSQPSSLSGYSLQVLKIQVGRLTLTIHPFQE